MNRLLGVICLALALLSAECSPFTSRPPNEGDLIGEYVPTDETLQRLKQDGYSDRDIAIVLEPMNGLSFRNLPDCWLSDFGDPHDRFDSGSGSWRTTKGGAYWAVGFSINGFTSDSASYEKFKGGFYYGDCAMVIGDRPPYRLAISVAASDKGYLEFRRK